nr:hypothetical protein Hi04_10k_c2651_00036 [uncultured bacterium]
MKRVVVLAMVCVLIGAVAGVDRAYPAAPGQLQWGSEPMPRAGVCFFDDTNFRGRRFCVESGKDVAQVPRSMNDKISSFRVVGNVEVVVFKDARFSGASGRFWTDVRDLRREGWNDEISSVRVRRASIAWNLGRFPEWGRQAVVKEGACFYRDVDFHGQYFCVPRGASYASVPNGFNDQISSIRILSAGGVLIFLDRDFGGRVARFTSNVPDLRRGAWNDKISSIRVY